MTPKSRIGACVSRVLKERLRSTAVSQDTLGCTCINLFKARVHAGLLNSFAGVLCIAPSHFKVALSAYQCEKVLPAVALQASWPTVPLLFTVITLYCE